MTTGTEKDKDILYIKLVGNVFCILYAGNPDN